MISKSLAAAVGIVAVILSSIGTDAAEVHVLCANGMRAVVTELHPELERTTGQRVTMSFGEAGDLEKRLEGGELADVIVLPKVVMEQLAAQNMIGARHDRRSCP